MGPIPRLVPLHSLASAITAPTRSGPALPAVAAKRARRGRLLRDGDEAMLLSNKRLCTWRAWEEGLALWCQGNRKTAKELGGQSMRPASLLLPVTVMEGS